MPEPDEIEEVSVSLAQAKSGVQLKPGHKVVLIVEGGKGTPPRQAAAPEPEGTPPRQAAAPEPEGTPEPAGPPPDPKHPLRNSRWGKMLHGPSEQAEMLADAHPSIEGRQVEFLVERRDGDAWKEVTRVQGTVQGGKVRATAQLAPGAGRSLYRFKPRLL